MDTKLAEKLSENLLLILIEKNCSDFQLENAKALLKIILVDKQIPQSEIKILRVNSDAVLLKSTKIREKQFPLIYFIAERKFVGYHEISNFNIDSLLHPQERGSKEAVESLRSFFRGCEMLANPNVMEALRAFPIANSRNNKTGGDPLDEDPGYTSQFIENSLWTVKYAASGAWGLVNYYTTNPTEETKEEKQTVYTDISALKTNWYGRYQKRVYRFYDDHFERIDPFGTYGESETIKASFKYSDVQSFTIENGKDLVIHFNNPSHEAQWIHSPQANKIMSIIRSRCPISQTLPPITRNVLMKMNSNNISTIKIRIPTGPIMGNPRWSKDGLRLAYEASPNSWKTIDLEILSISSKEQASIYDIVHLTTAFSDREQNASVGVYSIDEHPDIDMRVLERDFYEYSVTTIAYMNAFGSRTQHGGFIAEVIDPSLSDTNTCTLFVDKLANFDGKWRFKSQKLHLFDVKGGAPIISPDGKFVAFMQHNAPFIYVHKIDELSEKSWDILVSDPLTHPELITYDAKKRDVSQAPSDEVKPAPPLRRIKIPSTIPSSLHLSREGTNNSVTGSDNTEPHGAYSSWNTTASAHEAFYQAYSNSNNRKN